MVRILCYIWLVIVTLITVGVLGYACIHDEMAGVVIGSVIFFILTTASLTYVIGKVGKK